MAFLGPYYYGKHKWENYLLDIQQTIEAGTTAQRQNIRLQTKALNAAQEQQLTELRQQTEQMRRIENALSQGFEELRAEFEWGFTSIVDRMDTQIEQLSQIAARLDAIHKTLQSSLLTQARELFQLGQEHFRKGLLDKALEAYLKAEQKNEVDFPLQLQIGKLFLYGRDEDDDVIDLPQAERHLLLAARYSDAEKSTLPQWNEYCRQAYFHAAVAAYLIGEQEEAVGRPDSMRSCLERALGYLAKAAILWPRFTEIVYTQAKCHALLGQIQDASQKLEILSDRDRRYCAKASQDGDFKTFHADIEELFRKATVSPGSLAQATQVKLDEAAEAIPWAKRSAGVFKDVLVEIESIEHELVRARQLLPTLDVDIEGLNERLIWMWEKLGNIAVQSFQNNIDAAAWRVVSMEQRISSYETSIAQLTQTIVATSGKGMGCGFAALFFTVTCLFLFGFFISFSQQHENVPVIIVIVTTTVGAAIGSRLSRDRQNRPHKFKIEETSRATSECIRTLSSLRERAEAWRQEMRNFAAWQAQRPSPPLGHNAAAPVPLR